MTAEERWHIARCLATARAHAAIALAYLPRDTEAMTDETERVCCECARPASFGSATCERAECVTSLAAWVEGGHVNG